MSRIRGKSVAVVDSQNKAVLTSRALICPEGGWVAVFNFDDAVAQQLVNGWIFEAQHSASPLFLRLLFEWQKETCQLMELHLFYARTIYFHLSRRNVKFSWKLSNLLGTCKQPQYMRTNLLTYARRMNVR